MKKMTWIVYCILLLFTLVSCSHKTTEPEIYTIATPVISLASGTYAHQQMVTISCSTYGAEIRYTIDGTEPVVTSMPYTGAIKITEAVTLKAVAFKEDWNTSLTASASYIITSVTDVADPTFQPAGGNYNTPQVVSISCTTLDAEIRYTTNGMVPNFASTLYTGEIDIQVSTTLKAKAFKAGLNPSQIMTSLYSLTVDNPTISLVSGSYSTPQSVSLACATPGSELRYTTDGIDPTVNSTLYSNPISILGTTTLKVRAFKQGWNSSQIVSAVYSFNVAEPTFSLPGGTYGGTQTVSISCVTQGSVIRYTANGDEPTITSTLYTGPIRILGSTTIRAIAFNQGGDSSLIGIAVYTLTVAEPTFNPVGGTYGSTQTVRISCTTVDTEIRYTTNGDEPTISSTLYTGPIQILGSTTIRAIAFNQGGVSSVLVKTHAKSSVSNVKGKSLSKGDVSSEKTTTLSRGNVASIKTKSNSRGRDSSLIAIAIYTLTVAEPTFSPAGGSYNITKLVTIRCSTAGSQIRYTTNGDEPTIYSTLYSDPVQILGTTTIRAIAFNQGGDASLIGIAVYTLTVADPAFDLPAGSYNTPQSVTITSATAGAQIRYSTNGTNPTPASNLYSAPISVSGTTTIKARAFYGEMEPSQVVTSVYSFSVAEPTFNPVGGTYGAPQSVRISCTTPSTTIRYTTNGDEPIISSTLYTGPINIVGSTTLKAIAFNQGGDTSLIALANYTLTVAEPTFTPVAGSYNSTKLVSIRCTTVGSTIRYTTNGDDPISSSTTYTAPIPVLGTTTIKAIAFNQGGDASSIASAAYSLTVSDPVFELPSGSYTQPQSVTITSATEGAQIRYTTNGSNPTASSSLYSDPIIVNGTTTLKAKAFSGVMDPSHVVTAVYSFTVAEPTFNPGSGTYGATQTVSIHCVTPNTTIRYTTNGNEPNVTSTLYTNPIQVLGSTTIRAIAFNQGGDASLIGIGVYNLTVAEPTFNPIGGTYGSAQTVRISCATIGAEIRYTTDGNEPNVTSTLYTDPIQIVGSTTLKAIAFNQGGVAVTREKAVQNNAASRTKITSSSTGDVGISTKAKSSLRIGDSSLIAIAVYTLTVAEPIFEPAGGTFDTPQSVVLSCATVGSQIRYTTNGTEPTMNSALYSSPIQITRTTTLKAIAFNQGGDSSLIVSAVYTLTVLDPVILPSSDSYGTPQTISMSCPTDGAQIRYTTNGSNPTASSTLYVSPFIIASTTTIKAKAFWGQMDPSQVVTASYTIDIASPVFNYPGGPDPQHPIRYEQPISVSISCATHGAEIRYTTNGSTPTEASNLYTTPFTVSSTTVLKARAYFDNMDPSPIITAAYEIAVFSVPGMVFVQHGSFTMGDTYLFGPSDQDGLRHPVTLTDDYYIGRNEVSQSEFYATMGFNPSFFVGRSDRPVERVSWYEALAYCNKRSEAEGLLQCYTFTWTDTLGVVHQTQDPDVWTPVLDWNHETFNNGFTCDFRPRVYGGYRLPTEAEWEFAAKGGRFGIMGDPIHEAKFSGVWGPDETAYQNIGAAAWYVGNADGTTHPIGQKLWNELGAFDMSGNVCEWCWDWYNADYYSISPVQNPTGPIMPPEHLKVFRGGCWDSSIEYCRVSARYTYLQNDRNYFLGFRLARSLP